LNFLLCAGGVHEPDEEKIVGFAEVIRAAIVHHRCGKETRCGVLSSRELEVLGLVAEGLSNREIAGRLFIAERTVRYHLTSIFGKLGADNRTQAVALARQQYLL
jgi:ATP/maltotriose-dependent transcriptional regulator MalT